MDTKSYNFNDDSDKISIVSSLGDRLREAREAMGLSQQKIADSLCLKLFVIKSIEEGYIDTLDIASIFLYGYIRSYARLVGIEDEEIVVSSMKKLLCSASSLKNEKKNKLFDFLGLFIKNIRLLILVICIMFSLIIVLYILKYFFFVKTRVVSHPSSLISSSLIDLPFYKWNKECLLFLLEKNSFLYDYVNIFNSKNFYSINYRQKLLFSINFDFSEGCSNEFLDRIKYFNLYEDVICYENNNICDENNIICIDNNSLKMSFTSDCWIKVLDSNNKILFVGTQHTGDILNLIGEIPYRIVVGSPQSVEIKYQGNVVNLDEFIHPYKIARLTIPSMY